MVGRLRIARLDPSPYTPVSDAGPPDAAAHRRLQSTIRRHLPAVTASLLAEPARAGHEIAWYSDLAGQPIPLEQLSEPERAKARQILHDRLRSLARLAERLPTLEAGSSALAAELRQALSFPGEETVFVVDGQPVITFWGHRSSEGNAAAIPGVTAAEVPRSPSPDESSTAAPDRRTGSARWAWPLLASLLIAALLGLLARWQGWGLRWPPWGPDYPALLAAAQADEASARQRLAALEAELRARLEVCRLRVALERARDEEARLLGRLDALHGRLRDALAQCPTRTALAQAEARALQEQLDRLSTQLATRLKACKPRPTLPTAAPAQAREPPPPAPKPGEALRIPTSACQGDTIDFFDGRWESVSNIANSRTNEPVVLHYQIKSGRGRVAIVEGMGQPRQTCTGSVRAALRDCELIIDQPKIACPDGSAWAPTRTVCTPDATGKVACTLHQKGPPPQVTVQIIRLP